MIEQIQPIGGVVQELAVCDDPIPTGGTGTNTIAGVSPALAMDFDRETRPLGSTYDIGADEVDVPPAAPGPLAFGAVAAASGDPNDLCPNDPNKTEPGGCGCGTPDKDTDFDGIPDCLDECPATPIGLLVEANGCRLAQSSGQPGTPQQDEGTTTQANASNNDQTGQSNADQQGSQNNFIPLTPGCGFGISEMMIMSLFSLLVLRFVRRRKYY